MTIMRMHQTIQTALRSSTTSTVIRPTLRSPRRLLMRDSAAPASTAITTSIGRCFFTTEKADSEACVNVSLFKNPIVHQLWTARQKAKQQLKTKKQSTNYQQCVISKSPADSRVQVSYPFSTDALLWETYKNPWGQMRLGKLLEDLDALAGNIAFFHVQDAESNNDILDDDAQQYPVIVTASVDRIHLHRRPHQGTDQHLSGQVNWTGTSSMEIRMQCTDAGSDKEWLEAFVTFVTLDPVTKKPMRIPPVVPVSDAEKASFEAGAARAAAKKKRRKKQQQQQHHHDEPDDDFDVNANAAALLKEAGPLLTMPSLADPHSILVSDTAMQNAMIAQPQVQNLHSRIFGGFLMRRAFELAFSNAYVFGGARPIFLEVDEVSFASPVDVGDLLVFYSRVLYTERDAGRLQDYYYDCDGSSSTGAAAVDDKSEGASSPPVALLHLEVEAWVTEPENVSARMSNQFYFTFAVVQDEGGDNNDADSINNNNKARRRPQIRKVLPSNIDEARRMATRMHVDAEQAKS